MWLSITFTFFLYIWLLVLFERQTILHVLVSVVDLFVCIAVTEKTIYLSVYFKAGNGLFFKRFTICKYCYISFININFQQLGDKQTILNNSVILHQMQETVYIKHLIDEFHKTNYTSFSWKCRYLEGLQHDLT